MIIKKYLFLSLATLVFSTTILSAQSYIYLKDQNGVLNGIVRYEPTFINKYIKTNILCISKRFSGIICEYVADGSPVSKEPAKTLQIANNTPAENVENLKSAISDLDNRVKKFEQTKNPSLNTQALPVLNQQVAVSATPTPTTIVNTRVTDAKVISPANIVYQVIERAVPGPRGEAGPQGPQGLPGQNGSSGGYSAPSYPVSWNSSGAEFNGNVSSADLAAYTKTGTEASFAGLSASTMSGAGLSSCNATTSKLAYNSTTKLFECATDQSGGSGGFAGGDLTAQGITATTTIQAPTIYSSTTNSTTSNAITGNFTNLNTTNATFSNATITNLNISGTVTGAISGTGTSTFSTTTAASSTITNLSANDATINNSTSTNIYSQNASLTNATTTNLFAAALNALSAVFTNLTSTLATITTLWGTTSNFAVSNASTTNATTSNAVTANATTGNFTNLNSTNSTNTNSTSTNIYSANASISALTTNSIFSSLLTSLSASFTSLFASTANITTLNASTTNASTTNANTANLLTASTSYLTSTNATLTNATITNLSASNFSVATLTLGTTNGWLYGNNGVVNGSSSPTVGYITATSSTSTFQGLVVNGSILPGLDSVYDLGSPTQKFRSLYVSSSTIYIDDVPLSNSTGQLTWGGTGIVASTTAGSSTLGVTSITQLTAPLATFTSATATTLFVNNLTTGLTNGYVFRGNSSNLSEATSSLFISNTGLIGIGNTSPNANLRISQGTLAGGAQGALVIDGTWNNGGTIYKGIELDITNTAAHTNSTLFNLALAGASVFKVTAAGNTLITGDVGITGTTTVNKGIDLSSNKIINLALPTNNTDAANKSYVDAMAQGIFYKTPVLAISSTTIAASTTGDRYIVGVGSVGTGCAFNQIAQNTGVGTWSCETPATGTSLFVDMGVDTTYNFNGTSWISLGATINHANLIGLQGGTAGEYYHLNSTQYSDLNSINAQLSQLQTTGTATQFVNLTLTGGLNITGAGAGATITNATFTNIAVMNNTIVNFATVTDLVATEASITNATTTNFFTAALSALSAVFTNLLATNLEASNATTTNATSTSAYISSLLTAATANITTLFATTGTITNLTGTNATSTNSTSTNLYVSGTANFATAPAIPLTNGYVWRGSTAGQQEATSTLFISNDGKIGIGTTNPSTTFTVNSATEGSMADFNSNNANGGYLTFKTSGSSYADIGTAYQAISTSLPNTDFGMSTRGANGLHFGTNLTPRMSITGTGNVGIGTTTPGQKLDVFGNMKARGTIFSSDGTSGGGYFSLGESAFNVLNGNSAATLLTINQAGYANVSIPNGNIGIGTTTPPSKLFVSGGSVGLDNNRLLYFNGVSGGNSDYGSIGYDNSNSLLFRTNTSERMRIDASGNVGIGTTTPGSAMTVGVSGQFTGQFDTTHATANSFKWTNNGTNTLAITVYNASYVGAGFAGVTNAQASLSHQGYSPFSVSTFRAQPLILGTSNAERMRIATNGFVGVLNNAPSVALDVTGDIEYTGTITDVSDERLKENIQNISSTSTNGTSSLEILSQLKGKSFNMIGDTATRTEYGFIAQEVLKVIPGAVSFISPDKTPTINPETPYMGVSYLTFIPFIVDAINELALKFKNLAEEVVTNTLKTKILCLSDGGEEFCVNKEQFKNVFQNGGVTNSNPNSNTNWTTESTGSSTNTTSTSSSSPVVTLNGEANITLNLGDTYIEESATVTDDTDTGLTIVISGSVNTSVAGVYNIEYYSTLDTQGNVSNTVTRTVTVLAPVAEPAPAATSSDPQG